MMFACDELRFGYEGFERLIDGVRGAGYDFVKFESTPSSARIFRLRFDVDISPTPTVVLGDILRRRNLPATFLFQLISLLNILRPPRVLDTIDELRQQGHAVG